MATEILCRCGYHKKIAMHCSIAREYIRIHDVSDILDMSCFYHHTGGNVIDRNEALVNDGKGGGIYQEKLLLEVSNTVCLM